MTTTQYVAPHNANRRFDHFLDKPILRDLFWFVVLPHRLKQHLAAHGIKEKHNENKQGGQNDN